MGLVREALAGDAARARDLVDRCVRLCARQRVTALLAEEGGAHPSVEMLVAHGLRDRRDRGPREIEEHLPLCAACAEALRCVSSIRRAARTWRPEEDAQDEATDPRPGRRRSRRARSRRKGPRQAWPNPLEAWPLLALALLLLWWGWPGRDGEEHFTTDSRYTPLVDRTPPEPPPPSSLPSGALDAVRDLRRGDCLAASARLRTTRRGVPTHTELRLLEGATFVCAGDGSEALEAVEPLKGKVAGGEVAWTLARAHLLLGQPEPARRYLKEVIAVDARLRGRAGALLLRISEVEAE